METEFETGFREDSRHSDLSAFEEAAPKEYGDLAGLLSNKICMVAFVAFCFSEGYEKWFAMWLDVKCISDYVAYDNSNKDIVKKCLEYVKAVYFDKDGNMDFGKRGYTPKNIVYSMQPHFTGETSRLVIFIENMLRVNLRVSLYPSFWRSEYSRKLFAELKRYPIMFKSFDVLSPFHKEFPTAMSGMVRILENLDINEDIYRQIIVSYLESTIKNKCFSEYAVAFYPFDKDSACETESISSNESTGIADLRPISIKGFKRSARSDEQCESLQNENIRRRQKLIKKIARSMSVFRSISKKISH